MRHRARLVVPACAAVLTAAPSALADPAIVVVQAPLPVARSDEEAPPARVAVATDSPSDSAITRDDRRGVGALLDVSRAAPSYGLRWFAEERDHFRRGDSRTVGSAGLALDARGYGASAGGAQAVFLVHGGDEGPWAPGFGLELAAGAPRPAWLGGLGLAVRIQIPLDP